MRADEGSCGAGQWPDTGADKGVRYYRHHAGCLTCVLLLAVALLLTVGGVCCVRLFLSQALWKYTAGLSTGSGRQQS